MNKFFNPKTFLLVGGIVLILLGILGFIGLIGPTPEQSIFGAYWWFDNAENWAHFILGIVAVISAYAFSASFQYSLTAFLGVIGILVGLYGFVWSRMFFGAALENPTDNLLHVVVGGWALWSAYAERYSLWSRCRKGDMEACDMLGMHRVTR